MLAPAQLEDVAVPPPARLGRPPRELFLEYLVHRNVDDERLVALFDELMAEAHEA